MTWSLPSIRDLASGLGTAGNIRQVTQITESLCFLIGEWVWKCLLCLIFRLLRKPKCGNVCSAGYTWDIIVWDTIVSSLFNTCLILAHVQLVGPRCLCLIHLFSLLLSWVFYRQSQRRLINLYEEAQSPFIPFIIIYIYNYIYFIIYIFLLFIILFYT